MRIATPIAALLIALVFVNHLPGQELPAAAEPLMTPRPEHELLQKFVGQWETTMVASAGPDQPVTDQAGTDKSATECQGTWDARMLGKFWVVSEMATEMDGVSVRAVQTIGYDLQKGKYVGTWVDSMMNHLWHYTGTVDESGTKLTLEAEGPNFMLGGKLTKFRDAYEFKSPNHIIATSSMQGEDGKWITFMSGDMKRKE